MRRDCERLLVMLGIEARTDRHLTIIMEHIEGNSHDAKELLDQLGEWEEKDLKTVNVWYQTL